MKIKLNGFGVLLVILLTVANLGGLFYLAIEVFLKSGYSGSKPGSYSMAEAAYLGALWSEITAKACIGILLNTVVFGWILLNLKIDDNASELFRARVIASMDTLKEYHRKEEASRVRSGAEHSSIQPLASV